MPKSVKFTLVRDGDPPPDLLPLVDVPLEIPPPVFVVDVPAFSRRAEALTYRLAPWGDPSRAREAPPKLTPARAAAMARSVRVVLYVGGALLALACGPTDPDRTCVEVCTHNYPHGPAGAIRSCLDDCAIEPRQP